MKQNQEAWFLIVGDGPDRKDVEKYFESENLLERITFTGYVPHNEMNDYYKASDLFVFASLTETQGLVALEALASGTPVVAIAYKGVANVLKNGEGALTVDANEEHFYEAIQRALERKGELSKKGVTYVEQFWSMNTMVEKLEKVYTQAVGEGFIDFFMPSIINTSLQLKIVTLFRKFIELLS